MILGPSATSIVGIPCFSHSTAASEGGNCRRRASLRMSAATCSRLMASSVRQCCLSRWAHCAIHSRSCFWSIAAIVAVLLDIYKVFACSVSVPPGGCPSSSRGGEDPPRPWRFLTGSGRGSVPALGGLRFAQVCLLPLRCRGDVRSRRGVRRAGGGRAGGRASSRPPALRVWVWVRAVPAGPEQVSAWPGPARVVARRPRPPRRVARFRRGVVRARRPLGGGGGGGGDVRFPRPRRARVRLGGRAARGRGLL